MFAFNQHHQYLSTFNGKVFRVIQFLDCATLSRRYHHFLQIIRRPRTTPRLGVHHLAQKELKLKPNNCPLMCQRIQYLEHIVEAGGLSPDTAKVQAVQEWFPSKTFTELCSFLGLVGYFRWFIPKFAQITSTLTQLLSSQSMQRKGGGRNRWPLMP